MGKKPGSGPSDDSEKTRIRKSMLKWTLMDEAACRLGRGLGKEELIARVAQEVGASLRQVRSALRDSRSGPFAGSPLRT